MMSLATKLTALLIIALFLGATAQCAAACLKPAETTAKEMPCHQHGPQHNSCAKPLLTADRAVSAEAPAPTLNILPDVFVPVRSFSGLPESLPHPNFNLSPSASGYKTTVLLI
jgi:hypothetical protein